MNQESKDFGLYCQSNIQEPVEFINQSNKVDIDLGIDSKISLFTIEKPQPYPNKNEENLKLLQYKSLMNNREDNIYFQVILRKYIISQKYQTLEAIFENKNMKELVDYFKCKISEYKSQIAHQKFIIDLSEEWLLLHKFEKNNKAYISYQRAFEFWKFILERQFSKFKSFIDFVVGRSQVNPLEVTVESFRQIVSFYFLFQINKHEQSSESNVELINEFLICEDRKCRNLSPS